MKRLVLAMIIFISLQAVSQIQIEGSDMPQKGRINRVSYDTLSTPSLGAADSVPQTWDFSGLAVHYNKVASYTETTSWQQYASVFYGSNLFTYGPSWMFTGFFGGAPVDMSDWGYMYWKSDTTGFRIIGFRGNPGVGFINVLESPQEVIMFTPAVYGSSQNNTSRWEIRFNYNSADYDTIYSSRVVKTLSCDAQGTLMSSFGSFDVLRVHETLMKFDSAKVIYNGFPVTTIPVIIDTLNNYYFWAKNIGYPVCIVHADKNNLIKDIEYLTDTFENYSIMGTVYKHDGTTPVNNGKVHLLEANSSSGLYGIPEVVNLTQGGHFQFSAVAYGDWMIWADPDMVTYPYNMPTYYGDSRLWQTAEVMSPYSDTLITITTLSDSVNAILTGSGSISGTVWQDTTNSKANTVAAKNVKVTLEENPGGAATRHTETDANGQYNFPNLPDNNYRLHVEIAALPMDSTYYITLLGSSHTHLDFYYDSVAIYIFENAAISENLMKSGISNIRLCPNPVNDAASITFANTSGETIEFCLNILDNTGKIVCTFQGKTINRIDFSAEGLASGIYFFNVNIQGQNVGNGKMIVK